MVSLDDAVLARMEKGGKRYEILVDPDLVDAFKTDPNSVKVDDFFAMDEVFHDARVSERPTEEAIQNTFEPKISLKLQRQYFKKVASN